MRIDDILITDHSVANMQENFSLPYDPARLNELGHSPFTAAMTGSSPARISIILGYC